MQLFNHKKFEVKHSIDQIERQLENVSRNEFQVKKTAFLTYEFLANFSLGTLNIKGMPGLIDGIKTSAKFNAVDANRTEVTLTTSFRTEYVIIVLFWIGVLLYQGFGSKYVPTWITLILFPVILIWFWFVYSFQERSLQLKAEKFLSNLK
ncbi:hypothetical protein EON73_03725 [bacterium]|nr:MAG: hypothetical protein EON73_03725 [bacterium]